MQDQFASGMVLQTGVTDHHNHQQQQAQGIHHTLPLAAGRLLVDIHSTRFSPFGGPDTLAIENGGALGQSCYT